VLAVVARQQAAAALVVIVHPSQVKVQAAAHQRKTCLNQHLARITRSPLEPVAVAVVAVLRKEQMETIPFSIRSHQPAVAVVAHSSELDLAQTVALVVVLVIGRKKPAALMELEPPIKVTQAVKARQEP
jgi:hypothetical protein